MTDPDVLRARDHTSTHLHQILVEDLLREIRDALQRHGEILDEIARTLQAPQDKP